MRSNLKRIIAMLIACVLVFQISNSIAPTFFISSMLANEEETTDQKPSDESLPENKNESSEPINSEGQESQDGIQTNSSPPASEVPGTNISDPNKTNDNEESEEALLTENNLFTLDELQPELDAIAVAPMAATDKKSWKSTDYSTDVTTKTTTYRIIEAGIYDLSDFTADDKANSIEIVIAESGVTLTTTLPQGFTASSGNYLKFVVEPNVSFIIENLVITNYLKDKWDTAKNLFTFTGGKNTVTIAGNNTFRLTDTDINLKNATLMLLTNGASLTVRGAGGSNRGKISTLKYKLIAGANGTEGGDLAFSNIDIDIANGDDRVVGIGAYNYDYDYLKNTSKRTTIGKITVENVQIVSAISVYAGVGGSALSFGGDISATNVDISSTSNIRCGIGVSGLIPEEDDNMSSDKIINVEGSIIANNVSVSSEKILLFGIGAGYNAFVKGDIKVTSTKTGAKNGTVILANSGKSDQGDANYFYNVRVGVGVGNYSKIGGNIYVSGSGTLSISGSNVEVGVGGYRHGEIPNSDIKISSATIDIKSTNGEIRSCGIGYAHGLANFRGNIDIINSDITITAIDGDENSPSQVTIGVGAYSLKDQVGTITTSGTININGSLILLAVGAGFGAVVQNINVASEINIVAKESPNSNDPDYIGDVRVGLGAYSMSDRYDNEPQPAASSVGNVNFDGKLDIYADNKIYAAIGSCHFGAKITGNIIIGAESKLSNPNSIDMVLKARDISHFIGPYSDPVDPDKDGSFPNGDTKIIINSGNFQEYVYSSTGWILKDPDMIKQPINTFGEGLIYYREFFDEDKYVQVSITKPGSTPPNDTYTYLGPHPESKDFKSRIGVYLPPRDFAPEPVSPKANDTNVPVNSKIIIDFIRQPDFPGNMIVSTGDNIILHQVGSTDTIAFDLESVNMLNADNSDKGKKVTLTPKANLKNDTVYEVIIPAEYVRYEAINYYASRALTYRFNTGSGTPSTPTPTPTGTATSTPTGTATSTPTATPTSTSTFIPGGNHDNGGGGGKSSPSPSPSPATASPTTKPTSSQPMAPPSTPPASWPAEESPWIPSETETWWNESEFPTWTPPPPASEILPAESWPAGNPTISMSPPYAGVTEKQNPHTDGFILYNYNVLFTIAFAAFGFFLKKELKDEKNSLY